MSQYNVHVPQMKPEEQGALLELLSYIFESDEGIDGLVYLDIQKIFYHLADRLEDDNEIKELLPYYWYIDGTVSDTVQAAVNHGIGTDTFDSGPTANTGAGQWYRLSDAYSASLDSIDSGDLEAAKQEIDLVLDEDYDVFSSHEEKIEGIYEEAPYEFQRYFKLHILFSIEQLAAGRPLHLGTDNLASEISTAEAYLPLDPEFDEFNELFSRYVNTSKRYLTLVGEDSPALADRFKQLSESVWRLFCQQLRLLEHDPFYEQKVDNWKEEQKRVRMVVANDLVEFRRLLDVAFDEEIETRRVSEESSWGKIAAEYLDETNPSE